MLTTLFGHKELLVNIASVAITVTVVTNHRLLLMSNFFLFVHYALSVSFASLSIHNVTVTNRENSSGK